MARLRYAAALLLGAALFALHVEAQEPDIDATGVTYSGAGEDGGTITLALTPDRSGVISVLLKDFATHWDTPEGPRDRTWNLQSFYHPPAPISNGSFELVATNRIGGMVQEAVEVTGSVDGTTIDGVAVTRVCTGGQECARFDPAPWRATEQPPVQPGAIRLSGRFVDHDGRVTIDLGDTGSGILSFTMTDVSLTDCLPDSAPFIGTVVFDPPGDPASFSKAIVGGTTQVLSWQVQGSITDLEHGEGTLQFAVPFEQCQHVYAWNAEREQPPPTAAPLVTPGAHELPATGGGPSQPEGQSWIGLLALGGAALLAWGIACARRAACY